MEDFVYVLLVSNNINGAGVEHDIKVFSSLELAKAELNELKNTFLQSIGNEIDNYVVDDNSNDEYLASFNVYEDGFYNENYFDLTIYQREII